MDRIIFLVDMNAFFISCEMSRNNELKGKPAAVAGDPKNRKGIILSGNYDARAYGVKTTMTVNEAKKLCPSIILVPPDHDFYSKRSREVMNVFSRFTPNVQQNSIDEAWLDVTGCKGLFGEPLEIAKKIMDTIMNELDLWCSIGISSNKFLSKMASDMKKPLGITELYPEDIKNKLWPMPVRSMYGVGKQTEKKLIDMSIYTIGDLAVCNVKKLIKCFGSYGEVLNNHANGIDESSVEINPYHENKSISRSVTLARDTVDLEYVRNIIIELSEEIGIEARRNGWKGGKVSIVLKYSDFKVITRQKSITPSNLSRIIYDTACELLKKNWNTINPVRLVGVGLGNIEDEVEQLSLFDLVEDSFKNKKEEKLEKAMDLIREKYGMNSVVRAKLLNKKRD